VHDSPRAWFDATAERMLASRQHDPDLEVVGDLDVFQRDKRRRMLDWLAAHPVAGRRILEVGCGAAGNLRFLHERGARVQGADVSPRMVELARGLNQARGIEFPLTPIDGAHLPHGDRTFDVVLTVTALQHNHDGPILESLVGEIARVLRSGGEAWIVEGVHRVRSVHRQSVHRTHDEYIRMFTGVGLDLIGFEAMHSHYPQWMAGYQQVSTRSRRVLRRLAGATLADEHDFQRRFGDGARLDGLAARGLFTMSQLADRVRRAPDALGYFSFRKP